MTQAVRSSPRGLLAILLTGQLMANMDTAIVYVATPSIRSALQASGAQLELIVSGYVLSYAVLLVTGARLGDILGNRRVFLGGLAVFTTSSLACGIAPNSWTLIVARIVQGIGAALMVPQVLAGMQRHLCEAQRSRALGLYALTLGGAAVGGQVLGGALTSIQLIGGWRLIFLINVPIGVFLLFASHRVLPDDAGNDGSARLDIRGTTALSFALLLTIVPLILGREHGWPTWSWWCLAVGFLACCTFVIVERGVKQRGGTPLVDIAVVTKPVLSWGLTTNVLGASTNFALLFVVALYLQQGLGHSPLYSGAAVIAWPITFGVSGQLLGRFPHRFSAHPATLGYLILTAAYAVMGLCVALGVLSGATLILLIGVGGFGLGLGFSALLRNMTTMLPQRYAPEISGLVNMTTQLGGAIGVAVFGSVYLSIAAAEPTRNAAYAFSVTTIACAAASCLGALAAHLSVRRSGSPGSAEHT